EKHLWGPPQGALFPPRLFNAPPPFADFYRAALANIDENSRKVFGRDFALLASADQHEFVDRMRQNKIEGWTGRPGAFVYAVLRADAVDVVYGPMEGYEALGIPYMAHIPPQKRWGDGIRKSGHRHRRSRRFRFGLCIRAGQGGQEGRLAGFRSRLGAFRSHQFRNLGSPGKPAGAPILLEGKNPMGYAAQAGWGVGGATLHYFANFPRLLPADFRMKSEHGRGLDWPIAYEDVAPFYDKVAREIGVSGDARAEEKWRPAGEAYPMPPMKTFRNGDIWLKAFESVGIAMVPAPVGMNSVEFKGRPACIYDGWCHVGCPTGALANPHVT